MVVVNNDINDFRRNCVIAHNKFSVSSKPKIVRPEHLIEGLRSEIAIFASKVFHPKPFTAASGSSGRKCMFNGSLSHSNKRLITENEVLKVFLSKSPREKESFAFAQVSNQMASRKKAQIS